MSVFHGDCVEVMATLDAESVDAIVTDPPYGLEFMGKGWDAFRLDDPGTMRHRGDRVGGRGSVKAAGGLEAAGRVEYGAGKRPTTSRCRLCGKRDQFRNEHPCPDSGRGGSVWIAEPIDRFAAPPSSLAYGEWCRTWALEAYRVAKPGAHLLAFGGTRTSHRLASAIEDAGWEIRDCLVWGYASGFPKSHNLDGDREGWGTALKPAWEPIVMARKPLVGTVAANVQEYGTGALNIDGTRIGTAEPRVINNYRRNDPTPTAASGKSRAGDDYDTREVTIGRWPANVILTDPIFDGGVEGVVGGGRVGSGGGPRPLNDSGSRASGYGMGSRVGSTYGDSGTYSRFFLVPKASRSDREPVVGGHGLAAKVGSYQPTQKRCPVCGEDWIVGGWPKCGHGEREFVPAPNRPRANSHPTVKPVDLMRHLVRLVTPPGGLVLDPFLGSGTTALAAELEGFRWVGIEREAEYVAIAEARLNGTQKGMGLA